MKFLTVRMLQSRILNHLFSSSLHNKLENKTKTKVKVQKMSLEDLFLIGKQWLEK